MSGIISKTDILTYTGSQTKWGNTFSMRNAKTGLALRAKVDATFPKVTFYLLKPHRCKLFFAVWADWCCLFFFLKSNHYVPPFFCNDIPIKAPDFHRVNLSTESIFIDSTLPWLSSSKKIVFLLNSSSHLPFSLGN